jgi:hypothetical protein
MSRKHAAAALAAAVWLVLGPGAAPCAEPASTDPSKATISAVRELGTALYRWSVATYAERARAPRGASEPEQEVFEWRGCAALSREEAEALLVPAYVGALPAADGWGHPLELCLDRERVFTGKKGVLGVRSPGRDGRFEGDVYTPGAFDPADLDRDVVWMDGYFVTWPQGPGT